MHILAPAEGLRAPGVTGVNPGVDPRSQGVIPRRFKQKKILWRTDEGRTDGQTDWRDSWNSVVDMHYNDESTSSY